MIEEIGPNARKGKGTVQRLPSVADPATQPYREDAAAIPYSLWFLLHGKPAIGMSSILCSLVYMM
jgi:hypothetical protein